MPCRALYILLLLFSIYSPLAKSATAQESTSFELPIWSGVAPGSEGINEQEIVVERGKEGVVDRSFASVHKPTITVFQPTSNAKQPRPAIIICPGGGFKRVVLDKEANDFARFLNKHGIVGISLKYRTAESKEHRYGIPAPEADVKRAIRLVRSRADEWNLDPDRIGVFGFSAGGFIASTAAIHFDAGNADSSDPVERFSCRPDMLGLGYPVTTLKAGVNREQYRKMLLGPEFSEGDEMVRHYSLELQIDQDTPPMFLCHARNDKGVPAQNSELFEEACAAAGVACTSYICDEGGHGFGIRDLGNPINQWRFEFIRWLKTQSFINQ